MSTQLRNGTRVQALATVRGRTRVLATGTVRNYRLALRFVHLPAGNYHLTLWEQTGTHSRRAVGHPEVTVS